MEFICNSMFSIREKCRNRSSSIRAVTANASVFEVNNNRIIRAINGINQSRFSNRNLLKYFRLNFFFNSWVYIDPWNNDQFIIISNINIAAANNTKKVNPFKIDVMDCSWASVWDIMLLRSTVFSFSIWGWETKFVIFTMIVVIVIKMIFSSRTIGIFLFLKELIYIFKVFFR